MHSLFIRDLNPILPLLNIEIASIDHSDLPVSQNLAREILTFITIAKNIL
jgi:energy-converting hydrogenase Eha subunit E